MCLYLCVCASLCMFVCLRVFVYACGMWGGCVHASVCVPVCTCLCVQAHMCYNEPIKVGGLLEDVSTLHHNGPWE